MAQNRIKFDKIESKIIKLIDFLFLQTSSEMKENQ